MAKSLLAVVFVVIFLPIGCSGPARIEAPDWSPPASSTRAMQLWDTNQDGGLDTEELQQCPGLRCDLRAIDANKDGMISREELESRLDAFEKNRTGLKATFFRVTLNGRPLPDAEIRLIPEKFLEGIIQPATGKTNRSGMVRPQAASFDIQAMQVGYYRVEIESPRIKTDAERASIRSLGALVEPFTYAEQTLEITD